MSYTIHHGDLFVMASYLEPASVHAVVTSPPYAEQRKGTYGGVPEDEYPAWTVEWLEALRPALTPDASVMVNIRPHIKGGSLSDYVLRTRLAVREAGWVECEELIWHKPDAPPLGSPQRPRRAWESVHWFAQHGNPWVNVKANGGFSETAGRRVDRRNKSGTMNATTQAAGDGRTRCTDVFAVTVNSIRDGTCADNDHPAVYPVGVPGWLIRLVCPPGGTVLDPFNGSGSTGVAALRYGCSYIGIEQDAHYVDLTHERLAHVADRPQLFEGV